MRTYLIVAESTTRTQMEVHAWDLEDAEDRATERLYDEVHEVDRGAWQVIAIEEIE